MKKVLSNQITKINDISYEFGSNIPFTGCEVEYYFLVNSKFFIKLNFFKKLKSKFSYIDGKLDGPFESYFKNGQLEAKGTHDGNGYFTFEHYYENGQLEAKGAIRDGSKDGRSEFYYEDGKLRSVVNHENGHLHGQAKFYDKYGQLESIESYESGISVHKDTYK